MFFLNDDCVLMGIRTTSCRNYFQKNLEINMRKRLDLNAFRHFQALGCYLTVQYAHYNSKTKPDKTGTSSHWAIHVSVFVADSKTQVVCV